MDGSRIPVNEILKTYVDVNNLGLENVLVPDENEEKKIAWHFSTDNATDQGQVPLFCSLGC